MAKTRLNTIKKVEAEEDSNLLNGVISGFCGNLNSSGADCNSNNLTTGKENLLLCSNDSMQDFHEFLHDNSDYQWFLDYGYKYNNFSHHQSILSLTKSQDPTCYDDMARNIDANLAEVDMDDFNREDIHSVLSSLPNMQGVEEREMFASVTGSMMVKFDFDSSVSRQCNFREEQISNSICKSQLLFSPLKESYVPDSNLSVDSLDLSEKDINLMVTCQSNKNNYTIAFEASTVLASDDSETRETCSNSSRKSETKKNPSFSTELENHEQTENEEFHSDNHLATSDLTFTTWSKMKESPDENLSLKKQKNENNNAVNYSCFSGKNISSSNFRSISLPDLFGPKQRQNLSMSMSVKLNHESKKNSSLSNDCQYVKLYDIHSNFYNAGNSTSSSLRKPAQNFSLVKLFMKQKSESHEGMSHFLTDQITQGENFNSPSNNNKNHEKNLSNKGISDANKLTGNNGSTKKCQNATFFKEVNGNEKTKNVDLKHSEQNYATFLNEHFGLCDRIEKRSSRSINQSEESTVENGSNTESTENITCNSVKASSETESKKFSTEKSIQTSKYFDKNENSQKELLKVPVYILYPNYSLPNLEFLTKEHYIQNIDFSKVFLKPQKFQMSEYPAASPKSHMKGQRPFSVNDIETLKKTGFKHVKDWESLTFLLPEEYKKFLQKIPEIVAQLKDVKNVKEEVVPVFCLSPPPNRRVRKRPNSYDIIHDCRSSNFSSTATQPSSGYRGSSTMLNSNQSNNAGSARNPSFSYKYDNSELGFSRKSGTSSHKNYSSNSDDYKDSFSPRPPLPKSILRNNSLDNHQYTCKTQKEHANKRYSMVELSDKNITLEDVCNKKPVVSPKSPQILSRNRINEKRQLAGESDSNKSLENAEAQEAKDGSNLEKDMRKLEELLEISAVFGESVESFTETDMMKLRSQVSKFLTMQKNLERVSETLQTVDREKTRELSDNTGDAYEKSYSLNKKYLHTPHNTPEHKRSQPNVNTTKDVNSLFSENNINSCNGRNHEFEELDCNFREENLGGLKKTVSFAEEISFAVKEFELSKEKNESNGPSNCQTNAKRPVDLPICEESIEGFSRNSPGVILLQNSADLLRMRDLILDVKAAVKKILKLCKETSNDPANICLHHLCPSLYAVLSDGLKEEIDTPFGSIRNSVWSVIEASSQQGPMTQTLNELVRRLNREDIFTEGLIKFNAFVFGLLNARALSGWFSYLRTRDGLLRKYYRNSGLLVLSNTAGAPVRDLVDQLINILEPLSSLPFNLDLMYQTKLLHCSLQNLNCLLEEPSNSDFLTPTKQLMLLKLVQSIQNSICQSGEGKNNKHILEDIEQKTCDPPLSYLLEKNKNTRSRHVKSKIRPRSGFDAAVIGQEVNDVASVMKKRWSGVNLNSKLVEAFDRLIDDSESYYTDSLDFATLCCEEDTALPRKKVLKEKNSPAKAEDLDPDLFTKVQKKNILQNLNKKSCKGECLKTELEDKELSEGCDTETQNGGQKFKRLQQKWEKLSGRFPASDFNSNVGSPLVRTPSNKETRKSFKSQKSEKSSCDTTNTVPGSSSRISKIPRLVTSPVSATPTFKQTGNLQNVIPHNTSSDLNPKAGKITQNSKQKAGTLEGKIHSARGNNSNRCEEKNESGGTSSGKNNSAFPSGVSQKKYNNTKKNELVFKKAISGSFSKKPGPKKLHPAQRTVRTLTHRLPSDSGYLSFNKGERLKVVLNVDKAWLLCCRGNQKGLVPKSLVISDIGDQF